MKVVPEKVETMKGLGFPENEPDPVTDSALKDPTERPTFPAELKDLAVKRTLINVQEAEEVKVKYPDPLIGIPETVNHPEETKDPKTLKIGERAAGAPVTICKLEDCLKVADEATTKELPAVKVIKDLATTLPVLVTTTVVPSSTMLMVPWRTTLFAMR